MSTTSTAEKKQGRKRAGKGATAHIPAFDGVRDSTREHKIVDCRKITGSHAGNHRDVFAKAVYEAGYDLFEPMPEHPEYPPLWKLATSENAAERAEFLRIMQMHEGSNLAQSTIIDMARSMHSNPMGQLQDVILTYKGNKKEGGKLEIVAGHRRVVAALWNWCSGLWKDGPFVHAVFFTGNELQLSAIQRDENDMRKPTDPISTAREFQRAINRGASISQVAETANRSEANVKEWLSLLELEPKEQQKVIDKKLTIKDAVAIAQDRREGGEGRTPDGLDADQAATIRPRKGGTRRSTGRWSPKKMEAEYANPNGWRKGIKLDDVKMIIGCFLGKNDKNGTAIEASAAAAPSSNGQASNEGVAVMPTAGEAPLDLGDDEEIELDEKGTVVRKKK